MLNHYAYVFFGEGTEKIERLNANKLAKAIGEGCINYAHEWWQVMLCDPLAKGLNTLVSPISSREILIMGGS